jgi:hypothetical protein
LIQAMPRLFFKRWLRTALIYKAFLSPTTTRTTPVV